jgi:hypothetical protein
MQVYLAKWHSSEVAVKCLNSSLLMPDGNMGTAGGHLAFPSGCCCFIPSLLQRRSLSHRVPAACYLS